jgi:hypothetical protein
MTPGETTEGVSWALAKQTEERVDSICHWFKSLNDEPPADDDEVRQWVMRAYVATRRRQPLAAATAIARRRAMAEGLEWVIEKQGPIDALLAKRITFAVEIGIRTYHASLEGLRGPVEGTADERDELSFYLELLSRSAE